MDWNNSNGDFSPGRAGALNSGGGGGLSSGCGSGGGEWGDRKAFLAPLARQWPQPTSALN